MRPNFVIGIAGGTGSGKTTLARRLKEDFEDQVVLLCQDNYYKSFDDLSLDERRKLNYDHPDAFDTPLLLEHIEKLKKNHTIKRPVYSFVDHRRLEDTVKEIAKKVIIIEGILIYENPDLVNSMDIKVFVDTDADIRFARRIIRDIHDRGRAIDGVISQYLNTVKPMHEAFVEPSKKKADIVIPEGGMNNVAFSMLVDKINSVLSKN